MENIVIGGLSIYEIVWFFMLYSFLGWVIEVVYHAVSKGVIVNRGFLNGPVCPIYGFGMVGVFLLFNTLFPEGASGMHGGLLFLFGLALATAIELFGGWALDKIFHARWWDYSREPFNLNGYICPKFSLYWGLTIVFAVRIFHPFLARNTVELWPKNIGWPAAIVLAVVYMADVVVTVMMVSGLNKELEQLDQIQASMRVVSDDLTEKLGGGSLKTVQKIEEERVKAELAQNDIKDMASEARKNFDRTIQALTEKQNALYRKISENPFFGPKRLIDAFPDLKMRDHAEAFRKVKEMLEKAGK
ncbi:MAG: putative ABC transporter permease [Eubacterium sp.]|nr:putative ABC transporter permease [Eubacterium sp.]